MIRFFSDNWKYNFVDDRNVLAGFDNNSHSEEEFGYSIVDKNGNSAWNKICSPDDNLFPDVIFNTKKSIIHDVEGFEPEDYYGGSVGFPIINTKTGEEYLLVFYNSHNGEYYHDWEYKDGEKIICCSEI